MKPLNKVITNKDTSFNPIWIMRQAGRYLPEFKEIRKKNPNFINLCLNDNLSSEVTLQPLKRFDLDAAIIFSDILMVPYALGQEVNFTKNEGPVLSNFKLKEFLDNKPENFTKKLSPVYESISKVRKKLNKNKSLISFIGAPWTLLIYMMGLKDDLSSKFIRIKKEIDFNIILDKLNTFLCLHIQNQIEAGADTIQIFDSWAGLLLKKELSEFCYKPNLKLVEFCKRKKIPTICFPRGLNKNYLEFNKVVKPDGINLDYQVDPKWAKINLSNVVLQGGMNPKILLKSEKEIYNEAKRYLDIFKDVPYIFNLGHGLVPETDPNKLEKLIKFVREYK